jgi:hypothetical protein
MIGKATVLYTFDKVEGRNDDYLMLQGSIASVLKELPDAEIYIYTTNTSALEILHSVYGVTICHYDAQSFTHVGGIVLLQKHVHMSLIGHARVFLIPLLLEKYNRPVIYLDADTYVKNGKDVMELTTKPAPLGYVTESWASFEWLKTTMAKNENPFPPEFSGSLRPINNGVQIYPVTRVSVDFCAKVLSLFCTLKASLATTWFDDMIAFSAAWYEFKECSNVAFGTTRSGGFENPDADMLESVLNFDPPMKYVSAPCILQYYISKHHPPLRALILERRPNECYKK